MTNGNCHSGSSCSCQFGGGGYKESLCLELSLEILCVPNNVQASGLCANAPRNRFLLVQKPQLRIGFMHV